MAHLPPFDAFRDCGIPRDDPLRWYYHALLRPLYHRRVDVAIALAGSGQRVLELGYGSGVAFLELSRRFDEVHGLDAHTYGSRIAAVFAAHGVRARLNRGSVLALPYADHSFDTVFAVSILEHLQPGDQPLVMEEIRRVLRPRGTLVVGVPGLNLLMSAGFRLMGFDINQQHFSTPEVVLDAARKCFDIDLMRRQPAGLPAALITYQWFRGLKR